MKTKELHIISTGRQSIEEFIFIASEIHDFADYLHIREKSRNAREIYGLVNNLVQKGVPLEKIIINDRADVAAAVGAAGVQLGFGSLPAGEVKRMFPGMVTGCSVHSLKEARKAEDSGADFCMYGHIFSTGSKPGIPPRGLNELQRVASAIAIPVIAIGGIAPENAAEVLTAGAAGVAVLSGVLEAKNPLEAARKYSSILQEAGDSKDGQL